MNKEKETLLLLTNRIDKLLKDGLVTKAEFREFEMLILESLRAIMHALMKIL